MFDCLVAGDANVDIIVEGVTELEIGTEKLASNLQLVLGGSSSITAFNLAALGPGVGFVGVVGQDLFGRFVEEKLRSGGVDLAGLRRTKNTQTGVTIWHTDRGRRAGVTYQGAIASLERKDITDHLLRSAGHLHVGSYFMQTGLHNEAPDLFAAAKRMGLTTSVDCNYDPSEQWDSNLRAVLPHADLFFPNEDEAIRMTGAPNAAAAARELAAFGGTVIVKRGEDGAIVASPQMDFAVPAIPSALVDTTGAGDSFNAGFLSQFVKGADLETCVQAAVTAGARCVRAVGGTTAFEQNHLS